MNEEEKTKLKELVLNDITENLKTIKEKTKNETIYGFGLGLVEDLTGFFTSSNTIESLKRNYENEDFDRSDLWYISEWEYEGNYGDNSIYKFLSKITCDMKGEEYYIVRKEYEQILIESLKECKQNKIFDEQTIVYLHYADCFNEDMDDISSKEINSEQLHKQFVNRWSENKTDNLTEIIMDKVRTL